MPSDTTRRPTKRTLFSILEINLPNANHIHWPASIYHRGKIIKHVRRPYVVSVEIAYPIPCRNLQPGITRATHTAIRLVVHSDPPVPGSIFVQYGRGLVGRTVINANAFEIRESLRQHRFHRIARVDLQVVKRNYDRKLHCGVDYSKSAVTAATGLAQPIQCIIQLVRRE